MSEFKEHLINYFSIEFNEKNENDLVQFKQRILNVVLDDEGIKKIIRKPQKILKGTPKKGENLQEKSRNQFRSEFVQKGLSLLKVSKDEKNLPYYFLKLKLILQAMLLVDLADFEVQKNFESSYVKNYLLEKIKNYLASVLNQPRNEVAKVFAEICAEEIESKLKTNEKYREFSNYGNLFDEAMKNGNFNECQRIWNLVSTNINKFLEDLTPKPVDLEQIKVYPSESSMVLAYPSKKPEKVAVFNSFASVLQKLSEQGGEKREELIKKMSQSKPRQNSKDVKSPPPSPQKEIETLVQAAPENQNLNNEDKKNESENVNTNIIYPLLVFTISDKPHLEQKEERNHKRIFVPVSLRLEEKDYLYSKDVAKDDDEFFKEIAKDRQVFGENYQMTPDLKPTDILSEEMQNFSRIAEYLKDLSDDEKKVIQKAVHLINSGQAENFDANKMFEVEFYMKEHSLTQKNQCFRHSEQAFFLALKNKDYVRKIIQQLEQALKKALGKSETEELEAGLYKIYKVTLIMASVPNTVCSNCCKGLVALQNSHQNGFLQNLVEVVNDELSIRHFKLRDEGKSENNKFNLTTVVVADEAFKKNSIEEKIQKDPRMKLSLKFFNSGKNQWESGIDLKRPSGKYFYEFFKEDQYDTNHVEPFNSNVFVSGSDKSLVTGSNNHSQSSQEEPDTINQIGF